LLKFQSNGIIEKGVTELLVGQQSILSEAEEKRISTLSTKYIDRFFRRLPSFSVNDLAVENL
jgi:hypothetical protein